MCAAEITVIGALTDAVEVETNPPATPNGAIFCKRFDKETDGIPLHCPFPIQIFIYNFVTASFTITSTLAMQRRSVFIR
jgi:hypothetical protein